MALEGTLSDFGLADIFQLISIQSKTGVLTLKDGDTTVRVFFRDGMVINADSMCRGKQDRLGSVLVKQGRISEEELEDALKTQRDTLQQLGHILVSRSHVTADELMDSLQRQATQIIYGLFRWKEGEYHFDQDADVGGAGGGFEAMSSESILMEGARMLDEWPLIESRISNRELIFKKTHPQASIEVVEDLSDIDRDDDTALRDLIGAGASETRLQITQMEEPVYQLLDGARTVADVLDTVNLYEFDSCRALYEMAERGVVVEVDGLEFLKQSDSTERRRVDGSVVKALYVVLALWLAASIGTFHWNPLTLWAFPPSANVKLESIESLRVRLGLERVSLSLEAYHARHGRYPESLKDSVSEGLLDSQGATAPDGSAILYELDGEGFTLTYR